MNFLKPETRPNLKLAFSKPGPGLPSLILILDECTRSIADTSDIFFTPDSERIVFSMYQAFALLNFYCNRNVIIAIVAIIANIQ